MGLDIYAGTLTRYYSHNWKTVVQQWAEENGYTFNRITPDGEPADNEEELSPAEVQAAVEDWRDQILTAISQPNQPPYTPWPEDNERPYYTDKPDWDAFGAMLLVAACHTYEEPVPPTVEKDWDFGEHPLIARLASDEERVFTFSLDWKTGRNLNAFNDILRGGFGRHEYGQPIHIQWLSYEKSVRDLGKEIMDTIVEIIWIQTIPGTTVPWNGFDQAEKEASRWDLTSTPEH